MPQQATASEAAAAMKVAEDDYNETSKFVDECWTPAHGMADGIDMPSFVRSLNRRAEHEKQMSFKDEYRGFERASVQRWSTHCYLLSVVRSVVSVN